MKKPDRSGVMEMPLCERCQEQSDVLHSVAISPGRDAVLCPKCVREVAGDEAGDVVDELAVEAKMTCPECRALAGSDTVH